MTDNVIAEETGSPKDEAKAKEGQHMNYKEITSDKILAKISAAVELQYERITKAVEEDVEKRIKAIENWDGFGFGTNSVKLVEKYLYDSSNATLTVQLLTLNEQTIAEEVLKMQYVYQGAMGAKLIEKGWKKEEDNYIWYGA